METPESMKSELAAWNGGKGIDLETWVNCSGNFRLAVGYATIFWPEFVDFEGYILRKGFSEKSLRGFEAQTKGDRRSVETVMNHLHIADIQHVGCPDLTRDKVLRLGTTLKEIYEVKLAWLFPSRPCRVSFYVPPDDSDLFEYELTFWQQAHESTPA